MKTHTLDFGRIYSRDFIEAHFVGWDTEDGEAPPGYNIWDFFMADGKYLGADSEGIEPLFSMEPEGDE